MKHLLSLCLISLLMASVTLAQPTSAEKGTWEQEELTVPAMNFSLYLPVAPKVSKLKQEMPFGQVTVVSYEAESYPCRYKVMISEAKAEQAAALIAQGNMTAFTQSLAASMNAKIIGQFDLSPPALPGRETWFKLAVGVMRMQTFPVKNRLYSLMVATGNEGTAMIDAPETQRFFASFQLTGAWATDATAEQNRARGWKPYLDTEAGFQLWHPRTLPRAAQFPGQAEAIYGDSYWLVQSGEMVYLAFGYRYTAGQWRWPPYTEKSLWDLAQLWAEMLNVKINAITPVIVAGQLGLQLNISRGTQQGEARILWAKNRFLSAWAWGQPASTNRELATQFTHSLQPYEQKPIPDGAVNFRAFDSSELPPPPPPPPPPMSSPYTNATTEELLAHVSEKNSSDQPFALALVANATGIVNVKICVSKEGRVVCMGGQDGHPLLRNHAAFSVAQWKFNPLQVKGEPAFAEGVVPIVIPATEVHRNEAFTSRLDPPLYRPSRDLPI